MELSENSQLLMEKFMDKYNDFLWSEKNLCMDNTNYIFMNFYNDIKKAEDQFHRFRDLIKREIEVSPTYVGIKKGTKYIPSLIQEYSENTFKSVIKYTFKILQKQFTINFVIYPDSVDEIEKLEYYIRNIYLWLKISTLYSNNKCGKEVKIYIHFINSEKYLPTEKFMVLDAINANTAVTTGCQEKGEILIYRKEEWFKVLIHETFHLLGLDFCDMDCSKINKHISEIFPINSEWNIFEAYTEFWATVMNCIFCSYFAVEDEVDNVEEKFILYADFFIQFERIFSLYQCSKVLDFMTLQYTDLIIKTNSFNLYREYLYKEKTNIFSYYILKCILLYNYNDFLLWCDLYNTNELQFKQTQYTLDKFAAFISKSYKNSSMIHQMVDYSPPAAYVVKKE